MSTQKGTSTGVRGARIRSRLFERGLAPKTVYVYQSEIMRVEGWCDAHGFDLATLTGEALQAYVNTRPRTWSTRKLTRSALTHYWAIAGRGDPPLWAVRVPHKPVGRCRALEPEDARLLAKAARARGGREGLAVLLAMYVGLRREEIAQLRWADIRVDGWLSVFGKGEKPAQLPMHPAVIDALAEAPHAGEWIFTGLRAGTHVSPTTVWTWVVRVATEAGLGHVTTHVLRHTCLATANDNTGDLRAVQEFARHARPETTALYTRVTAKRLKAVMASLDY